MNQILKIKNKMPSFHYKVDFSSDTRCDDHSP